MRSVFVDGQHGTAGMRLGALLGAHPDVELLSLSKGERRDPGRRGELMARADLVALCLPVDAVADALTLAPPDARVLDMSNAHRCSPGWSYGLPELGAEQRSAIHTAQRVSNPGCFATGFILAVRPLVAAGVVPPSAAVHCVALTGYSAGGRGMVERHERGEDGARIVSLDLDHRHLPEMRMYGGLDEEPVFVPVVGAHAEGMHLSVAVRSRSSRAELLDVYRERYRTEPFVRVIDAAPTRLSPVHPASSNVVEIHLSGSVGRYLVSVRLNNLIKGAAGTSVQNINLMLGLDETAGLM